MGAISLILASLVGSMLLTWLSERKIRASINEVAPTKTEETSKNQSKKKKGQSKKKNHNRPPADYENLKKEVANLRLVLMLVSCLFIGMLMYFYVA